MIAIVRHVGEKNFILLLAYVIWNKACDLFHWTLQGTFNKRVPDKDLLEGIDFRIEESPIKTKRCI